MVYTPFEVRSQVGEALNLISIKDFPQRWPELIPALAQQLTCQDLSIARGQAAMCNAAGCDRARPGVLETANSVFKRFRNTYMSSQVSHDLEVSQKGMLKPLLNTLRYMNLQLATTDKHQLESVCCCVRLIFRIFYSLNIFGITEV